MIIDIGNDDRFLIEDSSSIPPKSHWPRMRSSLRLYFT